jgi:arylsulfatase A-like enzyme/Flp pilus assembly protein TadD
MPKKINLIAICLLLLPGAACQKPKEAGAPAAKTDPAPAPRAWLPLNLVLVTIDTLRADRLGCYGHDGNLTPHLDRLAESGVLFESSVAQAPSTTPSHASMFTGMYPTVHGVRNAGGFALEQSHQTLAEILREKGWKTAAFVGSAVLDRVYGMNQGFDVYDDRMPAGSTDAAVAEEPSRRAASVVDKATQWLRGHKDAVPFFLWVHVYDPHAPHDPPQPFRRKFAGRPYDGEVAYIDQELGRLLDVVADKAPADKTLTVVLADHGESLSEHGEYYHGIFLYDSTLRIPWIMSGPGIPRGVRITSQARTIDLLPTVMDLIGGKTAAAVQGSSLVPAFTGNPTDTSYSYAEALYPKLNMGWAELRSIRTTRWKYVRAPRAELYDLEKDPRETRNVIEQNHAEALKLQKVLQDTVASPKGGSDGDQVRIKTISPATERKLEALGYVSAGAPKSVRLTGQGIDPKDRVHILKLLEEAATRRKKLTPEQRLGLLQKAREEDPTNPLLYYLLGQAYETHGRYEEALAIYESAAQQKATATSKIFGRMGIVYGELGRLDDAVSSLRKALDLDPTDLDLHDKLALAYLLTGRIEAAENLLKFLLAANDENSQAHNNMGWIALKRGDSKLARRHFERAIALDPSLLQAYINLGLIYKEAGDYARARTAFEKYVAKASPVADREMIPKIQKELAAVIQLEQSR